MTSIINKLVLTAAFVFTLGACNHTKCTVNGIVADDIGYDFGQKVYLIERVTGEAVDSVDIKEGHFKFRIPQDKRACYRLYSNVSGSFATIIPDSPQIDINVSDFVELEGSPLTREWEQYIDSLSKLSRKIESIIEQAYLDKRQSEISTLIEGILEEGDAYNASIANSHPDDAIGITASKSLESRH